MSDYVLVVGSKPNSRIPKLNFTKIYSSNGSAEIASSYKQNIYNIPHICVVSGRSFRKLNHIYQRVQNSEINTLIIRSVEKNTDYHLNELNYDKLIKINNISQLYFQVSFFKLKFLNLIFGELQYENTFSKKIIHIVKGLVKLNYTGVSSGLFACLYALKENPKSNIILSGISFSGGNHYYSEGGMSKNRGSVDRYLFNNIKEQFREKIFSTDDDAIQNANINKWSNNEFI